MKIYLSCVIFHRRFLGMPVVHALGIDEIWFAVATLVNIEMGITTPPMGLTFL